MSEHKTPRNPVVMRDTADASRVRAVLDDVNSVLIDSLHVKGAKPRFQPGESVRCRIIGRDGKTGEPRVAIRLDSRLTTDCIATVRQYIAGDIGKYACALAPETVKA